MAPVTEIATFSIKSTADIDDPNTAAGLRWQDFTSVVIAAEGAQSVYFGRAEEEPTKVFLVVNWDDVECHKEFMRLDRWGALFQYNLLFLIKDPEVILLHASFTPHPPTAALSGPVTEVLTMYFEPSLSRADETTISSNLFAFRELFPGAAYGQAVEDDVKTDKVEGGKAKAFVALVPWESVEAHDAFRESQTYRDNIHLLREAPGFRASDMCHVRFKMQEGGGDIEERWQRIERAAGGG